MFQKAAPAYGFTEADRERGLKPVSPSSPPQDEVETVVGPSMQVEGDFASEGNIVVKGIVSGSVQTSRHLTVESGAKIFAHIKAGTATISGEVKGNVKVDGQVELTSTAQVAGDIECQVLVVEAGALLYGKVSMRGVDIEVPQVRSAKRAATRRAKAADAEEMSSDMEEEVESSL